MAEPIRNYPKLALQIMEQVDGEKNIFSTTRCATRLRLVLRETRISMFSTWLALLEYLTAVLHHEPRQTVFMDWAGDTMVLVDEVTSEVSKAYLFVGTLPYSSLVFVRAYLNIQTPA